MFIQNAKLGLRNLNFGKFFNVKIKILSTHNLLCRKFAASCPPCSTFSNPNAAGEKERCAVWHQSCYRVE